MLFLLILIFSWVECDIVRWAAKDSNALKLSSICSKQTLVLPEYLQNPVKIVSNISLSAIVLPSFGKIQLEDVEIAFGPEDSEDCAEKDVNIFDKKSRYWSDPDVWSSSRFNEATPDAERVPCFDDIVVFSENDDVDLDLPETDQFVKQIKLNDNSPVHRRGTSGSIDFNLFEFSRTAEQTFNLNSISSSGLVLSSPCNSPSGCPCQAYPLEVNCTLKKCPQLLCAYPVKPIGSCCDICGGVFSFAVSDYFVLEDFKKLVKQIVEAYGGHLVYHIGRLPNMVQLVIVDNGDYEGTSSVVVSAISHQIKSHWMRGYSETLVSGSSLAKQGLGGKIMVSMFFAVLFMMAGIYVYYYKVPSFQFPLLRGDVNLGHMRFQSRTESVVTLARRDSCAEHPIDNSFRNPMFDIRNDQNKEKGDDSDED